MLTTNTIGNSSPFDACTVIRLTASRASITAFDSSPAVRASMYGAPGRTTLTVRANSSLATPNEFVAVSVTG